MEIKNKLTVTRGEGRGNNRGKKGKGQVKVPKYKGPMDKDKGWGESMWEGGLAGQGRAMQKMRPTITEQ